MARFSCAAVDEDANQLEYVWVDRLIWLTEMFDGIWSHINPFREVVLIINLASRHSRDVKVESLEVKYEVVWYVFQTGPAKAMSVKLHGAKLRCSITFSLHQRDGYKLCRSIYSLGELG